jgi:2-isopropylmalate synthase
MWEAFEREYMPDNPEIALMRHEVRSSDSKLSAVTADVVVDGQDVEVMGTGNGPIEAFVTALNSALGTDFDVVDYAEHALGAGKEATAVAYVDTRSGDGQIRWGVGVDPNIMTASLRAVVSAFLRQRASAAVEG